MTKTWIAYRKTDTENFEAFVEDGRCQADGYYWCVRIDGEIYADGYTVTFEEAEVFCKECVSEIESKN